MTGFFIYIYHAWNYKPLQDESMKGLIESIGVTAAPATDHSTGGTMYINMLYIIL